MKVILILMMVVLVQAVSANVIITEVMPNPKGPDKALEPNGEWVELFNNGERVKISEYVLYDTEDKNELYIEDEFIEAHSYLVIYRNTDSDFTLNNKKDKVRLFYNGTLVDEMEYSNAKEGMSKALTSNGWVDQIPTPGEENPNEDQSDKCDWAVDVFMEEKITENPFFKVVVSKLFGDGNKIALSRIIKDENNNTVKEYKLMEFEAKKQKTVKNSPRLKPGAYILDVNIESLGCEDADTLNNRISTLFYVKGRNMTEVKIIEKCDKKPESFNITDNLSECSEIVINDTSISGSVVYESNDVKAKRYGLYFFCFLLILMIIAMKVDKNEKTGNNC